MKSIEAGVSGLMNKVVVEYAVPDPKGGKLLSIRRIFSEAEAKCVGRTP